MNRVFTLAALLLACLSAGAQSPEATISAARITVPLDAGWRYAAGDGLERAEPGYDDSGWESVELPGSLSPGSVGTYFWLRNDITIPPELAGVPVWFETGKAGCAFDVYVDGAYAGSRGALPPDYYVRPQQNLALLLPGDLAADGRVVIALRCYYEGSESSLPGFLLGNAARANFIMHLQNLFNMRVYVILAVICLFLGAYFIAQFIGKPGDRASLFYALSLIFIAIYFTDMGAERVIINGQAMRAIGRASLSASLGFLLLFLMKFFGTRGYKAARIAVAADIAVFGVAFIASTGNDSAINSVFNLSLLPVFAVIILGLVIVARASIKGDRDAWPILIGLVIGVGFGIHDIVYQVLGRDPFAWLQGFTFFALNLSVFIAMSARAARAERSLASYMKETSEQRDRLSGLVGSAERLTAETSAVARDLDEAVSGVAGAAGKSAVAARVIGDSVARQNATLGDASRAVGGLVGSIDAVNAKLAEEASLLDDTAMATSRLVDGFAEVAAIIEDTARLATSLDEHTIAGRKDVEALAASMDRVKVSSKEILAVVDAVNDFAERTNLLAMNASIEAAHAGAAGRGFAVIAQEIKKLAAASSERAQRIGAIAAGIDGSIDAGQQLGAKVRESLGKIAEGAAETAVRVRSAAEGTARQKAQGSGIAERAGNLAKAARSMRDEGARQAGLSGDVGGGMTELSRAAAEVGSSAAEIVAMNVDLAGEAEALRELAGRARKTAEELAVLMAR